MAASNDLFKDAMVVEIPTKGGTYVSPPVSNVGFGYESGEYKYYASDRTAWWAYKPLTSGTATFDVDLAVNPTDGYIWMAIWPGSRTSVPTDAAPWTGYYYYPVTISATAGTTYYIQLSTYNDSFDADYVLRVAGPRTVTPDVAIPPLDSVVSMLAGHDDPPPVETVPAEAEVATTATGGLIWRVETPGSALQADVGAPNLTRIFRALLDPAVGVAVPVLRPAFTVIVTMIEGVLGTVTVDVEYTISPDGPDAVVNTLTQDVNLLGGRNVVRLTAMTDIPQSVPLPVPVTWRARLRFGGVAMGWTPAQSFIIDPQAGDHTAQLTWSVKGGDSEPHLWHVTPSAGVAGDLVTVIGQGFSPSRGKVKLAGVEMPVQTWRHIPASPSAFAGPAVIDTAANIVDPDHDEVVVIVPDVTPPGGAIWVEDGDGTIPADKVSPASAVAPPAGLETSISGEPV